jgi:deazaflavin-dependent oxidoreductase (nitroreductase family)
MAALTSLARRLGSKRWFARVGRVMVPVDRALGKLTKGRFVAMNLPELPSMLLTTTGSRTGKERSSPLLYAPDGDAFIVVGSNWGQAHHPAWSGNLLANPDAVVSLGGAAIPVRAVLVEGPERERLWQLMRAVWPAYTVYESRSGRHIRVFRLERRS